MIKLYFQSADVQERLGSGPAGPYLDGFAEYLHETGYAGTSARLHLCSAEHLGVWAEQQGQCLADLCESSLCDFRLHLESCACPRNRLSGSVLTAAKARGAFLFLAHLRRAGVTAHSPAAEDAVSEPELLRTFGQWILEHRGVTDSTLLAYGRILRSLVQALGEDTAQYSAAGLRRFVLDFASRYSRHHAKLAVTAIRMFLRYLMADGKCSTGLDTAVPTVAEWRLSALPRYLPAGDVQRILASCDTSTKTGVRDHAVMLLIWRLGLRAGDVAALCFADIDWQAASLRVTGKGRRGTCLPMPQDVGDAIIDIFDRGRQIIEDDHVFLRAIAPWGPLKRYGVSDIVDRAIQRAGVSAPSRGAHLLRHSAATEMLRQGSSLQGVAAVLRHRSVETTAHYAKVDITMLREVAQPWPEVLPC